VTKSGSEVAKALLPGQASSCWMKPGRFNQTETAEAVALIKNPKGRPDHHPRGTRDGSRHADFNGRSFGIRGGKSPRTPLEKVIHNEEVIKAYLEINIMLRVERIKAS
jgi:hypothetical protein